MVRLAARLGASLVRKRSTGRQTRRCALFARPARGNRHSVRRAPGASLTRVRDDAPTRDADIDCSNFATIQFARRPFIDAAPAPKLPLSRGKTSIAHRIDRSCIMKRSSLFAAVALALTVSAPAFAEGGIGLTGAYGDNAWHGKSTRSRAEVRAELEQAQQDGSLDALRKTTSYPQGVELARRAYRPDPDANQLAGAGR
jgi:hypothetical protein